MINMLVNAAPGGIVILALFGLAVADYFFIRYRILSERNRAFRQFQWALCSGTSLAVLGAALALCTSATTANPPNIVEQIGAAMMLLGLIVLLIGLAFRIICAHIQHKVARVTN